MSLLNSTSNEQKRVFASCLHVGVDTKTLIFSSLALFEASRPVCLPCDGMAAALRSGLGRAVRLAAVTSVVGHLQLSG